MQKIPNQMTVIFNGQEHAQLIKDLLREKVKDLKENYNLIPKLAVFLAGDHPGSKFYTNLKKQELEKLGGKFEFYFFEKIKKSDLIKKIAIKSEDQTVHGIMVQLPLPKNLKPYQSEILNSITPEKDVDGLGKDSKYQHPTCLAILDIIEHSLIIDQKSKILLVGSQGFVGKKTLQLIKLHGYNVQGIDKEAVNLAAKTKTADVIISTTGSANLINQSMLKEGVSVIDIGYPKGDFDISLGTDKIKFLTPIKNGVGPLTISYLLDNLVSAAYNSLNTHT